MSMVLFLSEFNVEVHIWAHIEVHRRIHSHETSPGRLGGIIVQFFALPI